MKRVEKRIQQSAFLFPSCPSGALAGIVEGEEGGIKKEGPETSVGDVCLVS